MIVWSNVPREVGKLCKPTLFTDVSGNKRPGTTVLIAREATHDEWVADVKANGAEPDDLGPHHFYYEVAG